MIDPLDGFERQIRPDSLSGRTESVKLPEAIPEDDRPFVAYLGVFDVLVERLVAARSDAAMDRLGELRGALQSVEGALRYEWYEEGRRAESLERAARYTRREVALTRDWLVPKLEAEIELYRRRVDALRTAVGAR
jgi:hypothetical protein